MERETPQFDAFTNAIHGLGSAVDADKVRYIAKSRLENLLGCIVLDS